jgi:dTDP-4-dehydrorhamnose reductase
MARPAYSVLSNEKAASQLSSHLGSWRAGLAKMFQDWKHAPPAETVPGRA